jgi:hypothetical protein
MDIQRRGLMAKDHYDSRYMPPISRDFELDNFQCLATKCICNRESKCIAPSVAKIGEDGRCVNFKEKK